jgi:hypothetical protein
LIEIAGLAEDRALNIVSQVDESLKESVKKVDKSRDFRSFLKQQKQAQSVPSDTM